LSAARRHCSIFLSAFAAELGDNTQAAPRHFPQNRANRPSGWFFWLLRLRAGPNEGIACGAGSALRELAACDQERPCAGFIVVAPASYGMRRAPIAKAAPRSPRLKARAHLADRERPGFETFQLCLNRACAAGPAISIGSTPNNSDTLFADPPSAPSVQGP
jgi:hypothetical protein